MSSNKNNMANADVEDINKILCGSLYDVETVASVERGIIIGCDLELSLIVLKQPARNAKDTHHNIVNINLAYVVNISKVEDKDACETSSVIDKKIAPKPQTLNKKLRHAERERKLLHDCITRGISADGRKIYRMILNIFPECHIGDKSEIIVMNDVVVKPPYREALPLRKETANKTLQMVNNTINKAYKETVSLGESK